MLIPQYFEDCLVAWLLSSTYNSRNKNCKHSRWTIGMNANLSACFIPKDATCICRNTEKPQELTLFLKHNTLSVGSCQKMIHNCDECLIHSPGYNKLRYYYKTEIFYTFGFMVMSFLCLVWCQPELFGNTFSSFLVIYTQWDSSCLVGGAQFLKCYLLQTIALWKVR